MPSARTERVGAHTHEGADEQTVSEKTKLNVNWVQTAAGGLAAMSSAVLLSTTGVAGTVIGAAVGSVVLTVGSSVYSHYLDLSRRRVGAAREAARRAGRPEVTKQGDTKQGDTKQGATAQEGRAHAVRWSEAVRGLPWPRLLAASAGVFVLVMGTIVAFEVVGGRALSSYTGGSSRADGPRTSLPLPGLSQRDQRAGSGAGGRRAADGDEPADGSSPSVGPQDSTGSGGGEQTVRGPSDRHPAVGGAATGPGSGADPGPSSTGTSGGAGGGAESGGVQPTTPPETVAPAPEPTAEPAPTTPTPAPTTAEPAPSSTP